MKVVVIDDEKLVAQSFARLLQLKGFETAVYYSPNEFWEADGYEGACCLVVDYHLLPAEDGCDLLRELRARGVDTPAILLSGNVDDVAESVLLELNVSQRLQKPCSLAEFQNAIAKALNLTSIEDVKSSK